jgi:hypothetical protein
MPDIMQITLFGRSELEVQAITDSWRASRYM